MRRGRDDDALDRAGRNAQHRRRGNSRRSSRALSELIIRPAESSDVGRLTEIARLAYQGYVVAIGREPAPMVADFAVAVARGVVHVIARHDVVVGFAVSYPHDGGWHLENVAIDPVEQGSGLGRRLIDHVECRARSAGASAVDLYTHEKMTANLAYYPRLGYFEVGRAEQEGFSRVFFRKDLNH